VPIPHDESARLADLRRYGILDTSAEEDFDHLTQLAALICEAPIALLALVDSDRVWFKSKVGATMSQTSRQIAFCAFAILEPDLFVVRDAAADKRFANNPLVRARPKIRFYAGAPLVSPHNHALGTLCVLDHKPRALTRKQRETLRLLSRVAMNELEWRRRTLALKQSLRDCRLREQMWRQTARAAGAAKA
jgi:GAF domain-containing protein